MSVTVWRLHYTRAGECVMLSQTDLQDTALHPTGASRLVYIHMADTTVTSRFFTNDKLENL